MTRRAFPKEAVVLAHKLRGQGKAYSAISSHIRSELGIYVHTHTIRDWVTYYSRQP